MNPRAALALLFVVSLFNYVDRWMLAILVPDIKADLDLSDSQIGFITGIAFSLFYAVMGLPIARLADRHSRRLIVSVAMALWSAMTVLCGFAQSFVQLATARVLVGVGEAGATPPSHSLISDFYPRERRALALAIYGLGSPLGIFLGFLLGGWFTQNYGWRFALFSFGLPGLILAVVVYLVLKEPARGAADGVALSGEPPRLGECLKILFSRPTFIHNCAASALYTVVYLSLHTWTPSYFERNYEMSLASIGVWLAFIAGGSQLLGVIGGGWLADRLSVITLRWLMGLCSIAVLLAIPFYALAFLAPSAELGMLLLIVPFIVSAIQAGPQHATTQGVSPVAMRATAAATFLLIVNLVGGLGPQVTGWLSDYLTPKYGDMAIGWAVLIVASVVSVWSAWHFYLASKTLVADMARAKSEPGM
jgi:MFS family permease